jgi:hypothetical protein
MGMFVQRKLAALCSILLAECLTLSAFAIKVTEPAAAAHGYPGLCDINGKKLANGEFRQWVENDRLHVVVTYKFSAGEVYEEHAQFRQERELIQEKWSWKESKQGRSQREFAVAIARPLLAMIGDSSPLNCCVCPSLLAPADPLPHAGDSWTRAGALSGKTVTAISARLYDTVALTSDRKVFARGL